jgi:hypothetical protein
MYDGMVVIDFTSRSFVGSGPSFSWRGFVCAVCPMVNITPSRILADFILNVGHDCFQPNKMATDCRCSLTKNVVFLVYCLEGFRKRNSEFVEGFSSWEVRRRVRLG